MMKTFILHQGIWKMKRHLGHITDEEWSIFGKYKTQLQNYSLAITRYSITNA